MSSSAKQLWAVGPLLVLVLAGCAMVNGAPDSTNSNRIENAEPHTLAVSSSIESLQQQIWEGGWTVAAGGNLLVSCDSGKLSGARATHEENDYRFYGTWLTPEGYQQPKNVEATAEAFSSWLSDSGWRDVGIESSESPEYWRVWATREDAGVAEAMVTWYPVGNVEVAQPHAVLDVDSTCLPSDAKA